MNNRQDRTVIVLRERKINDVSFMIALAFCLESPSGKQCREEVHSKYNKITEFREVKAAGIHVAEKELQKFAQSSFRVHC